MICRLLLVVSLLLTLGSTSEAQHFLPQDCTALVELLPAPPANDSPAGKADLQTVLQVQADRTPGQIERAKRVANQSVTSFARPVLGEWFHSKDFPKTVAIFDQINRESQIIINDKVKQHWHRQRPYNYCAEVHPIVGRPNNSSYPSGHSAAAALWGTILSAAFPDKAAEFEAQVHEAMWCRVLGGAHFPSDTAAGEMLGDAIGKKMLESPEMQAALQTIREEIAPHLNAAKQNEPASSAHEITAPAHN